MHIRKWFISEIYCGTTYTKLTTNWPLKLVQIKLNLQAHWTVQFPADKFNKFFFSCVMNVIRFSQEIFWSHFYLKSIRNALLLLAKNKNCNHKIKMAEVEQKNINLTISLENEKKKLSFTSCQRICNINGTDDKVCMVFSCKLSCGFPFRSQWIPAAAAVRFQLWLKTTQVDLSVFNSLTRFSLSCSHPF